LERENRNKQNKVSKSKAKAKAKTSNAEPGWCSGVPNLNNVPALQPALHNKREEVEEVPKDFVSNYISPLDVKKKTPQQLKVEKRELEIKIDPYV
jgi:hypothetical protein